MTVEQLHDALGMLPSDLIAETDKRRNRGAKPVIHWHRWVSMAACIVLILGCSLIFAGKILPGMGGMTESAADCAPQEPAALMEESCMDDPAASGDNSLRDNAPANAYPEMDETLLCDFFQTPGDAEEVPEITLIRCREELESYWETYGQFFDFTQMRTACEPYDAVWFESQDMLLIPVLPYSGDTVWEITAFTPLNENGWEWAVSYAFHSSSSTEEVSFHLLTGVEKGLISPEDDILTVADTVNSTVDGEPFNE